MVTKIQLALYRMPLLVMMVGGGYLIRLSYFEYAKWSEFMSLGDPSGAELYETGFRLTAIPGFGLLILSVFLFGISVSTSKH